MIFFFDFEITFSIEFNEKTSWDRFNGFVNLRVVIDILILIVSSGVQLLIS